MWFKENQRKIICSRWGLWYSRKLLKITYNMGYDVMIKFHWTLNHDNRSPITITTNLRFAPTNEDHKVFSKIPESSVDALDKADKLMWFMVNTPYFTQRLNIIEVTISIPDDIEVSWLYLTKYEIGRKSNSMQGKGITSQLWL